MTNKFGERRYVLNKGELEARLEERRMQLSGVLHGLFQEVRGIESVFRRPSIDEIVLPFGGISEQSGDAYWSLYTHLERVLESGGYVLKALKDEPAYNTAEPTVRSAGTEEELFQVALQVMRLLCGINTSLLSGVKEQLSQLLTSWDVSWEEKLSSGEDIM